MVAGGTIFFGFYPDDSDTGDIELWTSDGTAAGTASIASLTDLSELTAVGNRVYFTVDDPTFGNELFTSDGTTAGTGIVDDINPGPNGSFPGNLTAVGDTLYFDADDGTHGDEPWEATAPASVPTPQPANPTPINAGSVFTATGSFTDSDADGPWTATVNYGDGSGDQPLALNVDNEFSLQHQYQNGGSYTITVTVTGSDGVPGIGTETLSVLNVPPTATVNAPVTSPAGTPIAPTATINDPSPLNVAAGFAEAWSVTLNGVLYASGTGSDFCFTPDDIGNYVVTLTATDENGNANAPTSATIEVYDVPPTVTITAPARSPVGTPITPSAVITDPVPADTAAGFAEGWFVTVNGVPYTTGTGSNFSFTPTAAGTYVVTLTATDKNGNASAPASVTITVFAPAPTVQLSGDSSGVRGQLRNLSITVTDPSTVGTAADLTTTINWGDGTPAQSLTPNQSAGAAHVFTQSGTYTVTVTVQDKNGGTTTASWSINISAAAFEPDPNNPTLTDLVVGGTTGSDTILFQPGSAPGSVNVTLNGSSLGTFKPTGRIIAFGQAGNDLISVSSAITLTAELHAGTGDDVLIGGGGDNILVGGTGNDTLIGFRQAQRVDRRSGLRPHDRVGRRPHDCRRDGLRCQQPGPRSDSGRVGATHLAGEPDCRSLTWDQRERADHRPRLRHRRHRPRGGHPHGHRDRRMVPGLPQGSGPRRLQELRDHDPRLSRGPRFERARNLTPGLPRLRLAF